MFAGGSSPEPCDGSHHGRRWRPAAYIRSEFGIDIKGRIGGVWSMVPGREIRSQSREPAARPGRPPSSHWLVPQRGDHPADGFGIRHAIDHPASRAAIFFCSSSRSIRASPSLPSAALARVPHRCQPGWRELPRRRPKASRHPISEAVVTLYAWGPAVACSSYRKTSHASACIALWSGAVRLQFGSSHLGGSANPATGMVRRPRGDRRLPC